MIIGVGVDMIEIARIEEAMRKFPDRFERKMFTDTERDYCRRMPVAARHFAARFAAKEAFLKALGTGKSQGIGWRDVGIVNLPSGQPTLALSGKAAERAAQLGAARLHVSLTHTHDHAVAVVVLEGGDGQASPAFSLA
jgi:holo-[acyl-carrier protein] synthase